MGFFISDHTTPNADAEKTLSGDGYFTCPANRCRTSVSACKKRRKTSIKYRRQPRGIHSVFLAASLTRPIGRDLSKQKDNPVKKSSLKTMICKRCGAEKPLKQFKSDKRYKAGRMPVCLDCCNRSEAPEFPQHIGPRTNHDPTAKLAVKKTSAAVQNEFICILTDTAAFILKDRPGIPDLIRKVANINYRTPAYELAYILMKTHGA